eukprot:TRINITY_DN4542_c0_g1_i1.p1 TRINITY_DN4542_c0_g1~~TRINITY_DN4542_c0_g1_i1.p1  ORF type:complete len:111 (+),score=32.19 TRINITY_DN4542_c0_g1_i1:6-338(+)
METSEDEKEGEDGLTPRMRNLKALLIQERNHHFNMTNMIAAQLEEIDNYSQTRKQSSPVATKNARKDENLNVETVTNNEQNDDNLNVNIMNNEQNDDNLNVDITNNEQKR